MAYGAPAKLSRNAPCHCGSGRKYKKCCLRKDSRQNDLPPEVTDSTLSDRRQRLEASFELVFGPQKSRSSTRGAGRGEPATRTHWRELILKLDHPDGSYCDISLLRPLTWLLQTGAEEGGTIFLDLPEMGARGQARVQAIRRCPPIDPGQGSVITGTFHHSAGLAGDLVLEGEPEPLGVTPSHPFWSVDRQEWIPAGQLLPGEQLKTLKGTTTVVSFELRKSPEPVYNIEVEGDHVYRVGTSGVLVHNTSVPEGEDFNCDNLSGSGSTSCTASKLWNSIGGRDSDWQPHHLIPCSVRNYSVIQHAQKLGYDLNGTANGLRLPSKSLEFAKLQGMPYHRGNPISRYKLCLSRELDQLELDYVNGDISDCEICPRLHGISKKLKAALLSFEIWLNDNDLSIEPEQQYLCPWS